MTLAQIFEKPINRQIDGVIKADDEASLRTEVEEYVLTNEIAMRLDDFLKAYINYDNANGVWISGFFGSGKSHLLKILSLLLDNRAIDNTSVLELFLPKCGDVMLRGDLDRAAKIPAKNILFNIDQKAVTLHKSKEFDALLSVFVKVFDEACGYYDKQPHIAKFERDLDKLGLLQKFKDAYADIAGKEWKFGREQAILEADNISKAYAQIKNTPFEPGMNIVKEYRDEYKISIEDFAEQVKDYIDTQGKDFRMNFFVDEVGQYIADNIKLMTNLQTIAESLNTKCKGRAWIVVTAQEEMNNIIGEMAGSESSDFSKIQARFANRLKLTSSDVDEVIQKRLLLKNEQAVKELSKIYDDQSNNFKTLFDFSDGVQRYRNFSDKEHFIHCYPFIPYQFTLFQSSIQALSRLNAFEGKHSSVGERSMLAVFQQVAIQLKDHNVGDLATFDLMFEGIRNTLKSQIYTSILNAEKNLNNDFAIRVLKALFLVKYIKEFKASKRNISILVYDSFSQDITTLHKQVEEALNLLEDQVYIQRQGDFYEFLTDTEKDIEKEIKTTEVEGADIQQELSDIVFTEVIKNNKVKYDDNGENYAFTKKLDDKSYSIAKELAIHIITPIYPYAENLEHLKMQSTLNSELIVLLPADERLIRDLFQYKRTEKYIRLSMSSAQQTVKSILLAKSTANQERKSEIKDRVLKLLGHSKLIVSGGEVEANSQDPQTRITQGFYELLVRTYTNLNMIKGNTYTEDMVLTYISNPDNSLFGNSEGSLTEAETEMLNYIKLNKGKGLRTTVKGLLEQFETRPYGWYRNAVYCILAKLCARGKVEVRSDSNILEGDKLAKAILNTQMHPNLLLEPQQDYSPVLVRKLKEFYEEFFGAPTTANDAKELGRVTALAFENKVQEIQELRAKANFSFLKALDEPVKEFQGYTKRTYDYFLGDFTAQTDTLLELKENLLDPIFRFMNGPHCALYAEAIELLKLQSSNIHCLDGDEAKSLSEILQDPECFKGNKMQTVKGLLDTLKQKIDKALQATKLDASQLADDLQERLVSYPDFAKLSAEQQEQLTAAFTQIKAKIAAETLIFSIKHDIETFEREKFPQLLSQMHAWQVIPQTVTAGASPDEEEVAGDESPVVIAKPKQAQVVSSKMIKISPPKLLLEDENDVDEYLAAYKALLMKEINDGKRIQV